MMGPILGGTVQYTFIDKEVLRCCSKEKKQQAEMFFNTVWKGELGPGIGSAAFLAYEGLGTWSAQWGRETTLPPMGME